jgi:hypothetical protein
MTKSQAIAKYGEKEVKEILEMAADGYGSSGITWDGPRRADRKRFTVRQIDAIVCATEG